ncbi:hypothetical protein F511_17351 [Dorcoceras hygrometricum]|uniref:Uncharacterized protein n=1 Tax=Dorcoceras hygrometricum TaxID=472368 RepID=A0A2Z7ACV2_9LAMI|nr:hypothetical protein F511_17351 [Dorcoceras hygrometricum]
MADQTSDDEVFDFSNVEFTREDLVQALNDMVHEYKTLSHTFEEIKAENASLKNSSAESISDDLEDTDSLKTELSRLKIENELLRNEASELKAEVDKLTKEMSSWNQSTRSLQKLNESLKQVYDKSGIGFSSGESSEGETSTQPQLIYDKFNKMSFVKANVIYDCFESVTYDDQNSPKLSENGKAGIGFSKPKSSKSNWLKNKLDKDKAKAGQKPFVPNEQWRSSKKVKTGWKNTQPRRDSYGQNVKPKLNKSHRNYAQTFVDQNTGKTVKVIQVWVPKGLDLSTEGHDVTNGDRVETWFDRALAEEIATAGGDSPTEKGNDAIPWFVRPFLSADHDSERLFETRSDSAAAMDFEKSVVEFYKGPVGGKTQYAYQQYYPYDLELLFYCPPSQQDKAAQRQQLGERDLPRSTSSKIIKLNPTGAFQLFEGWELTTGPHGDTNLAAGSRDHRKSYSSIQYKYYSYDIKSCNAHSSENQHTSTIQHRYTQIRSHAYLKAVNTSSIRIFLSTYQNISTKLTPRTVQPLSTCISRSTAQGGEITPKPQESYKSKQNTQEIQLEQSLLNSWSKLSSLNDFD